MQHGCRWDDFYDSCVLTLDAKYQQLAAAGISHRIEVTHDDDEEGSWDEDEQDDGSYEEKEEEEEVMVFSKKN